MASLKVLMFSVLIVCYQREQELTCTLYL